MLLHHYTHLRKVNKSFFIGIWTHVWDVFGNHVKPPLVKYLVYKLRFLDMRYEVREYDCGDRDGNKMVIEGVEEDNLSPAGEIST